MWHTSHGIRTLAGHEADLVLESVGHLRDMIAVGVELDEPFQSDVSLFNTLQPTQQLALLHQVAFGLLDTETPPRELNAVLEATIHVLFRELLSLVEIEIDLNENDSDSEPDFLIRTAILLACQQVKQDFLESGERDDDDESSKRRTLETDCDRIEQWEFTIEWLSDQILWDRDFEFDLLLADEAPEKTRPIKTYLGINQDYFSTPAPDISPKTHRQLDLELVKLTAANRPLFENSDEWQPEEFGDLESLG